MCDDVCDRLDQATKRLKDADERRSRMAVTLADELAEVNASGELRVVPDGVAELLFEYNAAAAEHSAATEAFLTVHTEHIRAWQ